MKIWNICPTHDPAFGGLYRGINDFAEALDAPILSFDDGRSDRSKLNDLAIRIPAGTGPLSRDSHLVPRAVADHAASVIAGADLLVVHSLFRGHARWAAAWAERHRKPYWAVPHGCLDPWSLRQRAVAKRLWFAAGGRRYLDGAARVIFSTRRGLEKAGAWVAPEQATAVYWPVDVSRSNDCSTRRAAFRARYGIPSDAPLLLFVGRLHPVKRPIETVEAFCRAGPTRAHLFLAGMADGVAVEDLMRAVPVNRQATIHIAGGLAQADLNAAYQAADGFISLSFQENFGYAAAEAIAYGLPVILSPGHDLAYDLPKTAEGRLACGWLLKDDSAAAVDAAISDWAAAARGAGERFAALGAAGRCWAGEMLSRHRFRAELKRLI